MTDPDAPEDDMRWVDDCMRWTEIMNKSHGYGGVFNHRTSEDKEIVEIGTAREWQESIAAEFGLVVGTPKINADDPPDCYVQFEGRHVGVELVQLIDQNHKWRATKEETPYAGQLFSDMQWSKERFEAALKALIQKKGDNYEKRNLWIDVLVIHTAEPWLHSKQAKEWLKVVKIRPHANIGSAFLLFEYEPGRGSQHWPVFCLYGHLTTESNSRSEGS